MSLPFSVLPFWDGKKRDSLPVITVSIIAANVFFFLLELSSGSIQSVPLSWGVLPDHVLNQIGSGNLIEIVSAVAIMFIAMFLHAGWLHLIGNMVTLFAFGPMLEDKLGRKRFAALYFTSGFIGTLTYVLLGAGGSTAAIGASVALFGLMGACMVVCAREQMWAALLFKGFPIPLPLPFRLPVVWIVAAVMLFQFFDVLAAGNINAGGVAGYEHFGGFIAGFGLAHLALHLGWLQRSLTGICMRSLETFHLFLLIAASILVAALLSAVIGKNLFHFLPILIVIAAMLSLRRDGDK